MDSVAGEQLPLTSFFGRAAPLNSGKSAKKKKDAALTTRRPGKQSKLALAATPPCASSSSSRTAAKRDVKPEGPSLKPTVSKTVRSLKEPTIVHSHNTRSHQPSNKSLATSHKRPLPTAIQPMTPALSSPRARQAREKDNEDSSSLPSLSPSPPPASPESSPVKRRRIEHDARTPAAPQLQLQQLPTPTTASRILTNDRLRQALRFKTPPPDVFDNSQSQSQDGPGSPTPLTRTAQRRRVPPDSTKTVRRVTPEIEDEDHASALPPSPLFGLSKPHDKLSTPLIPTSQSPEKLFASRTLIISPKHSHSSSESPLKAVPSSQAFESPIKMRAPSQPLSKKQSIVPTSQYFEQSYHILRSPSRSQRAPGDSISQPGSPVRDVPGSQFHAEDDPFMEHASPECPPSGVVVSSQTQLMSPVREKNITSGALVSLSPVKSSQAEFEDDIEEPSSSRRQAPVSATPTRPRHHNSSHDTDLGSTPIRGLSLIRSSSPLLFVASSSSCPSPRQMIHSTILHATPRVLEEFAAIFHDDELPVLRLSDAGSDTENEEASEKGTAACVLHSPRRASAEETQSDAFPLLSSTQSASFPLDMSLSSSHPSYTGAQTFEIVRDFCGMFEDESQL